MIRIWASFVCLTMLATACDWGGATSNLDGRSPNPTRCGAPLRGLDTLATESRLVILGEPHGTREIPAAVGEIVCQLARRRVPLVVGIEHPETDQKRIDQFVASSGTEHDRDALLASPFWRREDQDGRSSVAILALIDRIRSLRASSVDVRILAFDVARERFADPAVDRDAEMAKTILATHASASASTVIVLSGNFHAMTSPLENGFRPMGAYLRQTVPALTSLNVESSGGTGWMCTSAPKGCGIRDVGGIDRGASPFVELVGAKSDEGFDGVLYVGRVSPSSPPVPPNR